MNALFHQDELVEALAEAFPEGLRLSRGTQGRTLKLQRNAGIIDKIQLAIMPLCETKDIYCD